MPVGAGEGEGAARGQNCGRLRKRRELSLNFMEHDLTSDLLDGRSKKQLHCRVNRTTAFARKPWLGRVLMGFAAHSRMALLLFSVTVHCCVPTEESSNNIRPWSAVGTCFKVLRGSLQIGVTVLFLIRAVRVALCGVSFSCFATISSNLRPNCGVPARRPRTGCKWGPRWAESTNFDGEEEIRNP